MCGLMGLISLKREAHFSSAFASIKSRGPDASATSYSTMGPWQVELGHHRLSVIDLTSGQQPMTHDSVTVVYNGEIYNHRALALQTRTPLKTTSDTEVLLRRFSEVGPKIFQQLNGFFSAAFVDHREGRVTLVRDPWGIKPLYFAPLADGGLMFSSELKPFLKVDALAAKPSQRSLQHYLFWEHVPYDESILEGVFKLRPGHYLVWQEGVIQIHSYAPQEDLLHQREQPQSANQVWHKILEAVERAFTSDVPVGLLLSGGLDSSLLALAAYEIKGKNLPTFSIGFADKDFDESTYAASVAQVIGAEHHSKHLSSDDLLDRWQEIVQGIDEPLADPSLIPTRLLCELAREQVKVVLGGDGGDELFGGYPTYRAHAYHEVLSAIPDFALGPMQTLINSHLKMPDSYQPLAWKLKRLIGRFDRDPVSCHFRWMSVTDEPTLKALFKNPISPFSCFSPLSPGSPHLLHSSGLDSNLPTRFDVRSPNTWLYLDLTHYLPYSVLTKVDRASMAVGLECRPPLLDRSLAMTAFSLPWAQKVDGSETKVILREILRGRLPHDVVDRPKRGFAIPLARWLKGPLKPKIEAMLTQSSLFRPELIHPERIQMLWQEFLTSTGDHGRTFWALLTMDEWLKANHLEF